MTLPHIPACGTCKYSKPAFFEMPNTCFWCTRQPLHLEVVTDRTKEDVTYYLTLFSQTCKHYEQDPNKTPSKDFIELVTEFDKRGLYQGKVKLR